MQFPIHYLVVGIDFFWSEMLQAGLAFSRLALVKITEKKRCRHSVVAKYKNER